MVSGDMLSEAAIKLQLQVLDGKVPHKVAIGRLDRARRIRDHMPRETVQEIHQTNSSVIPTDDD